MKCTNEWVRRKEQRSVKELQGRMRVALWANDVHGRHQLAFDDFPFEEVIKIHFVEEVVVSGFSILVGESPLFHQRFPTDYNLHEGESLNLDMRSLGWVTLPLVLS